MRRLWARRGQARGQQVVSVRARLALLIGLAGLLASAATLLVAYAVTSAAIAITPIDVGATPPPSLGSDVAKADFKARQAAAEMRIREGLREATLPPLRDRGLAVVGAVTVASLAGGWYAAGLMLRPLRRITETARRVADRSLHERVALARTRDEWWELGSTINDMLSRLDAAFAAQRQFVGNASHELKTPLAINQTLLEVAMDRPDAPPELLRLGETMLEVNARHERLVDGLLALARAEHGVADPRPVPLADVVEGVLAMLRPEAHRLGLRVEAEVGEVTVLGDRVLLDRLLQNLVQNAIRHNVSDGWVRVFAGPSGGGPLGGRSSGGGPSGGGSSGGGSSGGAARIIVANSGPTVPASRVPELFEPFQRATNRVRSAKGSGLGLSIVRSVVRAHGGTVDAVAREGGGLKVTVTIPTGQR